MYTLYDTQLMYLVDEDLLYWQIENYFAFVSNLLQSLKNFIQFDWIFIIVMLFLNKFFKWGLNKLLFNGWWMYKTSWFVGYTIYKII